MNLEQLIEDFSEGLKVDIQMIEDQIKKEAPDTITDIQLLSMAIETIGTLATRHHDYSMLAGRLAVHQIKQRSAKSIKEYLELTATTDIGDVLNEKTRKIMEENSELLDSQIVWDRDFDHDYFAVSTMKRIYLMTPKYNNEEYIIESPQIMHMRVACGIHTDDIDTAIKTYHSLSQKKYTHATPTLMNAGTTHPQMSSCFLLDMYDDSITGIFDTLKDTALISKFGGGIGITATKVRSKGSYIASTQGHSNGIVPFLRIYNETARAVDQGGGKRKGSFAFYMEPWHLEIESFLDLKKNHGKEELRARDLFLALWNNDLFMERVINDDMWTLFDPKDVPDLVNIYGDEFRQRYEQYERIGLGKKTMKAQKLWMHIANSNIDTGTPYILNKDRINKTSMQMNLGTIKSSNLCSEITEFTSPDEIAVCNLATIAVNMFYDSVNDTFNWDSLRRAAMETCANLNKVIDGNFYPVEKAKLSNLKHRPIGIGIQGLADLFAMMGIAFDSEEAKLMNRKIFEYIYFGALDMSAMLAMRDGSYETYEGSPASKGKLSFDLWNENPSQIPSDFGDLPITNELDWSGLKAFIEKHGLRNSLLIALPPTASTSQLLGNNECFEPFTSNLYSRRTLSGEYIVINKHLVNDLEELGLWNEDMRKALILTNGSVQALPVPQRIKDIYKTAYEVSQKTILQMARDRQPFVDQSQSMNLFMSSPNVSKFSSMHVYAWKLGLKTNQYYLRSEAAAEPIKGLGIDASLDEILDKLGHKYEEAIQACSIDNPDACDMCGG